jgi:type I restriction enzyme, S subunit
MELNELCELIVDCEHKTAPTQDTGYPSIRTPNIGKGVFILDGVNRVSEETYRQWTRRAVPQAGDLIMAREAPVGNVAMIPPGLTPCLGQRTLLIRPDRAKVEPAYLNYFLNGPYVQSLVQAKTNGATVPHLNMKDVRTLLLPELPPPPTQRRIASILAAYDDLIENSQRRIKILEAMARALYREWFVHFRFPGHENHPRVASPLGEIPEGWEVKKLADVAVVNRAQINARNAPDELHYIDIASVSPGQIDSVTTYTFADAPGRARRVVQHGDVLWSCVRPNRRSFALVMRPEAGTIASTGFAVLTATKVPFVFLYLATTTDGFVAYLSNNATGAAYPAVTAPTFEKAELVVPGAALLKRFGELATPMLEETHALHMQVRNLRRTRDLLLPRLLSGQIALDELEAV